MKSILELWPTLPIAIRYNGIAKPKAKALDNITLALRDPDRVCEIDIGVTSPMLGLLLDSIQQPFPALERIRIMSNSTTRSPPIFDGTFLGGYSPRLQTIHLSGISVPLPALRRLLLSANHLDTLELHHIPNTGYFSPEDLVTSLSALTRLRRLSLRFCLPTSRLAPNSRSTHQAHITLSSLQYFEFHGTSEYLERLVSRINVPGLRYFTITFYNRLIFEIPQLCQFIGLVDALRSPTEAIVEPSQRVVLINLIRRGERRSFIGELCIYISCRQLDWQLSSAAQLFSQLNPFLTGVRNLTIRKSSFSPTTEENDVDSAQWLELFVPFSNVQTVNVSEKFVPDVVQDLGMATEGVLPALTLLHLHGYRKSASVQEAAKLFVDARERSGHKINLNG
jgi:hypothetical protein